MDKRYDAPRLTVLGSVAALTLQPLGKQFTEDDGSNFQGNFSCTRNDDMDPCNPGASG